MGVKKLLAIFVPFSLLIGGSYVVLNTVPKHKAISNFRDDLAYKNDRLIKHYFSTRELVHVYNVSVNGSDVLNLLRIQKTGSTTMDKHLTSDLVVSRWCDCNTSNMDACQCFNEWKRKVLFKHNIHHWPCGIHADWTYTQECVNSKLRRNNMKQRHLYLTMVRDPVKRYLSEWKHVVRGATWVGQSLICRGKSVTADELPPCYTSKNWVNVPLREFMACPSNLAVNRQTRMLADLTLVNCYNHTGMTYEERHERMLKSAKENLKNMAFFGITDFQVLSQILFQHTFNLSFTTGFHDSPQDQTHSGNVDIKEDVINRVTDLNKYDVSLYQFAKDLFIQRLGVVSKTTQNRTESDIIRKFHFDELYN